MTAGGPIGRLGERLRAGETLVVGWSGLAEPALAELLARAGFDAVILDMQHGTHSHASALAGINALALVGTPAIVRIPVDDLAAASRLCDAGAAAVIAPMVNSVAEATALVAAVKYPPLGARSWGPHRALPLSGLDPKAYFAAANAMHLAIPMIETQAALDAIDGILAVPGVDGVYVGPGDLSIALTGGPPDPRHPAVEQALDHIAARARAAGKFAGLFCFEGAQAKAMGDRGFALCSIASESLLLGAAARAAIAAAR